MGLFWVHYKNVNQGSIVYAETATKAKYVFARYCNVNYCNVRVKTIIKDLKNLKFPGIIVDQTNWLVALKEKSF